MMDKDTRKVVKAAERQGFTVTVSSKGHPVFRKDGRVVATTAGTSSDWRGIHNLISQLRAAGFVWPPRR